MERSLAILMEGLIDYAGLFPPASLDMPAAVRNYADYAKGPQAAWLGRFVLPAGRLEEFRNAVNALDMVPDRNAEPWRLSVLAGGGPSGIDEDLRLVESYNRATWSGPQPSVIDAVEIKAETVEDVAAALRDVPPALAAYFEIPLAKDPGPLLSALKAAGARAKVRTGGVTPAQIPAPEALARFLAACAKAKVPFKATAGLHHPMRGARKLTYAPDSPEGVMHGFLNVFLASAFAAAGMDAGTLAEILEEEDPSAFEFLGQAITWRGRAVDAGRLAAMREDFALSFGSCSFEEPRDDLARAGLL